MNSNYLFFFFIAIFFHSSLDRKEVGSTIEFKEELAFTQIIDQKSIDRPDSKAFMQIATRGSGFQNTSSEALGISVSNKAEEFKFISLEKAISRVKEVNLPFSKLDSNAIKAKHDYLAKINQRMRYLDAIDETKKSFKLKGPQKGSIAIKGFQRICDTPLVYSFVKNLFEYMNQLLFDAPEAYEKNIFLYFDILLLSIDANLKTRDLLQSELNKSRLGESILNEAEVFSIFLPIIIEVIEQKEVLLLLYEIEAQLINTKESISDDDDSGIYLPKDPFIEADLEVFCKLAGESRALILDLINSEANRKPLLQLSVLENDSALPLDTYKIKTMVSQTKKDIDNDIFQNTSEFGSIAINPQELVEVVAPFMMGETFDTAIPYCVVPEESKAESTNTPEIRIKVTAIEELYRANPQIVSDATCDASFEDRGALALNCKLAVDGSSPAVGDFSVRSVEQKKSIIGFQDELTDERVSLEGLKHIANMQENIENTRKPIRRPSEFIDSVIGLSTKQRIDSGIEFLSPINSQKGDSAVESSPVKPKTEALPKFDLSDSSPVPKNTPPKMQDDSMIYRLWLNKKGELDAQTKKRKELADILSKKNNQDKIMLRYLQSNKLGSKEIASGSINPRIGIGRSASAPRITRNTIL